jgi:hypothetical protein
MSVYVDDFKIRRTVGYGHKWVFSHMIADTREELDEMAEKIELDLKWKKDAGTRKEHFDVTENYRQRAIEAGSIQVSTRELHQMLLKRDLTEYLEGRR